MFHFPQGCELIVALTHMRTPNDFKLANNASDIDIILGGHDHVCENNVVNEILFIHSLIPLFNLMINQYSCSVNCNKNVSK